MLPGPVDVLALPDLQEQLELLGEQRVVVIQLQTEERKRLDERAATDDHLRAAVREQIEGGELLKDADRVGRAEDGHRTGEAYPARSCRRRCERDDGGGVEVLPAMMLADAEDVQTHLVGVLDLFDEIPQPLRRFHGEAGLVVRRGEAINSDLHVAPSLVGCLK